MLYHSHCIRDLRVFRSFTFPLVIILHIKRLSTRIATMDRAFINIGFSETIDKEFRHSLHISHARKIIEVGHLQMNRTRKIGDIHGVFALLIQKELHVKCIIIIMTVRHSTIIIAIGVIRGGHFGRGSGDRSSGDRSSIGSSCGCSSN